MEEADTALIFFDPHAVSHKKLPPITAEMIREAFQKEGLLIFHDSASLQEELLSINPHNSVFLLMSSGNFGGIQVDEFGGKIVAAE